MAVTNLRVKVGDRWYTVTVGDLTRSPVEVTVEGETFQVEIEGLEGLAPPPPARRRSSSVVQPVSTPPSTSPRADFSDNVLRSPMPGRVLSIMVRPGDAVAAGDEVCVVEAMKMEQSIRSTRDGVVKEVHVQPMDSVSLDDPLVELE